jgi:hypothetical protein
MYVLGGTNSFFSVFYAICDLMDTTAETSSAVSSANLSSARGGIASVGNPATAGYTCGGATTSSTLVATGDKTVVATNTTSAVASSNLSGTRLYTAGLSERSTKGYFAGGQNTNITLNGAHVLATTDKITFSTDTTSAAAGANLSQARGNTAGMNGSSAKGYWAGGETNGPVYQKTADKITFSGDTTSAQASANLSTARGWLQAGGDGSTKGYFVGGQTGVLSGVLDGITISTDTTALINSASMLRQVSGYGSDGNKFVCAGGQTNAVTAVQSAEKITFSTDTLANFGASISQGRDFLSAFTTQAL